MLGGGDVDALAEEAAASHGLLIKFCVDDVQHIIANGLNGRPSLFKPATPQTFAPLAHHLDEIIPIQ
jgi:hypothetical protein